MKKFRKYFFRTLWVVLGTLVILMAGIYIYVTVNKDKIVQQVTADISKRMNGKVSIGKVELSFFRHFPTVSVLLHDVSITDTLYQLHKHPFLTAREVYAQLSVNQLIKKKSPLKGIRINDGGLYLYTDSTGYTNSYLLQPKKNTSPADNKTDTNRIKYIDLQNFSITIDDARKPKLHRILAYHLDINLDENENSYFIYKVDADLLVHGMGFNVPRGTYLTEKKFRGHFDIRYDKNTKQLLLDSINFRLEDHPFNMTASFTLTKENPTFFMRIHTKNIVYNTLKEMLPLRIARSLSIVSVNNPIDADADISGSLQPGDPLVQLRWHAKEINMTTPFMDFDEAKFTGYFTNEVTPGLPRKDPNSMIVLQNFSAMWHNLPMQANRIEIMNLSAPVLTCDFHSAFELQSLNEIIASNTLQFGTGSAAVSLNYKGPLQRNDSTNSKLDGFLTCNNGSLQYIPRALSLQQLKAQLIFKNADVYIQQWQSTILNQKFTMQLAGKNLLSLINKNPDAINIDWNIYTPSLNLNSFMNLLAPRKKTAAQQAKKHTIAGVASKLDGMFDKSKLNIQFKTDRLNYKKFDASQVQANISFLPDSYLIKNASMLHANGQLNASGVITPVRSGNDVKLNLQLKSMDVKKLFYAFENFGQDGITYQNLEGKLSSSVVATMFIHENGQVDPSRINSLVDFSLKEGALINYEPVKKLQRFIFKKRDFDNIRFAELKDRLEIKNREIKINRMEIQSSVLSMFVEGIYSKKGNTDISIQVPLNNLKKRDADYNPENIGLKKNPGKSIFLRGRPGDDGNVKFGLDLFNKYGKENK